MKLFLMMIVSRALRGVLLISCLTAGAFTTASPAAAAQAQLRACGVDACLLVEGRRTHSEAKIWLADHVVAVDGKRVWRASIPLNMIREWSPPFARAIRIRIEEPDGTSMEQQVRLPIGLLGNTTELAELEISAK